MSKAEALVALQRARHSSLIIDEFVAFTDEEWSHSQRSVLRRIGDAGLGPIVAVRSSAAGESFEQTEAPGRFHTELGVPLSDYPRLVDAIDRVRQSMASTARGGVIIQTQLTETTMAGVATTIDIRGVPYTTVEYDDQSGRTDAVTSGDAVKRALIADLTAPPIGKWTALSAAILDVQATLNSDDLVIEFAVDTTGQVHVFQAWTRRQRSNVGRSMLREAVAAAQAQVEDLRAASNSPLVLSDMTDWNPAEILGATPRPLDVSLYRSLITDDVWSTARANLGYHRCDGPLLVEVGGHPYIDVRRSFLSLTPRILPSEVRARLVDDALTRLQDDPNLHDKVESDLLITYWPLDGEEVRRRLSQLSQQDQRAVTSALRWLSRTIMDRWETILESTATAGLYLTQWRLRNPLDAPVRNVHSEINLIRVGLDFCEEQGTLPFAEIARLAFIASGLVRDTGASTVEAEFWENVRSPAEDLADDLLDPDTSLEHLTTTYGHLRPQAYNIASARYDAIPGFLRSLQTLTPRARARARNGPGSELTDVVNNYISDLWGGPDAIQPPRGLDANALSAAVTAREHQKFLFSAILSDSLERIARLSESFGCSRDDVRVLDIERLLTALEAGPSSLRTMVAIAQETSPHAHHVRFPDMLTPDSDLRVVEYIKASPTFVTDEVVNSEVWILDAPPSDPRHVDTRVVAIESADPGYDWIFSRPIAGLVTSYGGANSHMAIRCRELALPAAIGCGPVIFSSLTHRAGILLDCRMGAVIPLGAKR